MFRVIRQERQTRRDALTLVSDEWTALAGARRFGVGISYVRPSRVVVDNAQPVRVVDYLMVMRASLLVTLVAAALWSVWRD